MKGLAFVISALLLLIASGCAAAPTSPSPTPAGLEKPKPVVLEVKKGTGGTGESYYAVLDITVRNEGADGTAVVMASIIQGATTLRNEFPVFLPRNDKQTVRLIFPLKWGGGDFTHSVTVELP